MDVTRAQTNGILEQFNECFTRSRKEMIERFLQDQQELNNRFKEYALISDNDESDTESVRPGITADCLKLNFANRGRDDDEMSITSVMTQCSFSDEEEQYTKKNNATTARSKVKKEKPKALKSKESTVKNNVEAPTQNRPQSASKSREEVCQRLSLSTPRFGVPERKGVPFGRSKSLRAPAKTSLSTPMSTTIEPPPNSPEEIRRNIPENSKPPLDGLKVGRRSMHEKKDKPKKLLTKRTVRPSTAMGLQSSDGFSLVPESDNIPQDRLLQPSGWDLDKGRKNTSIRSAPQPNRNRVISWDKEESPEDVNPFKSRRNSLGRVPPLPMSISSKNDNNNPQYALNYENSSKKHTTVSRSKSINHSKPLLKSSSDYFPLSHVELGAANRAEYERMNEVEIQNTNSPLKRDTGSLRRYKGHSNLTRNDSTRGKQLAVLKLPPVSKKTHSDIPSRSSTSMGYFNKEASMMKMMPVHIGEEF